MLKALFLSSVAVVALSAGANAADMAVKAIPPGPVWSWTGLYIGANAGVAYHELSVDYSGPQGWDTSYANNPLHMSKVGGTLGGQVGYNYQIRSMVIGVESDLAWLGGMSSSKFGGWSDCSTTNCLPLASTDAKGLWSVRARFGIDVMNGTLLYATAGFGEVKINNTMNVTGANAKGGNFVSSKWAPAFVVGGGIEQMIDSRWSLRGEVLFAKTEDQSAGPADTHYFSGSPVPPVNYTNSVGIGRIAINYKIW